MQVKFTADQFHVDEEAIVNAMASRVEKHLTELGQHVADVAAARAPVGKESHSTRTAQRVFLRGPHEFTQGAAHGKFEAFSALGRGGIIRALRKAGGIEKRPSHLQFFRGKRGTPQYNQSPTKILLKGNTLVGHFATHEPGTLRRSIKFEGVTREGNTVAATVRAHAPYAMAIHEGFKHKGGRDKQGEVTEIPGRPFLKNALINIQGRLTEPTAYEG